MDLEKLEALLNNSFGEFKDYTAKANAEFKSLGEVTTATKTALEKIQKQVDAIDEKMQARILLQTQEPLEKVLKEHEGLQRLMKDRSGRCSIELKGGHALQLGFHRKTTITTANVGTPAYDTPGVLATDRDAGITAEARRALVIRDLLATRPTTAGQIAFVRVANPLVVGGSQSPEGAVKHENELDFEALFERVRTIATWIPASRQLLDDWGELMGFLQTGLSYYARRATENQLLNGNGLGETLNGILPQATAFNTALLPGAGAGSWQVLDVLGWAMAQIESSEELEPDWILVNPLDRWEIRMTKDTQGRYILGDPNSSATPNVWGKPLVSSSAIAQGTFLVGSGDPAALEVRPRMDVVIDISTEHSDYFTRNLIAIRAEERIANVVKRPGSFVTGSLNSSPE